MSKFEHFLRYQSPAVAWALLIFILSSIPGTKLPEIAHEINDKIEHASVYFIFGLLIYRAIEPRNNLHHFSWMRLIVSIGIVILYGITDEIHQGFVPGRTEDVLDAAADTTGGFLSAVVMYIVERRRIKTHIPN
jgi:VanZ family protein